MRDKLHILQVRSCDDDFEWYTNSDNSDALCFPSVLINRNVPCICKFCPYNKAMQVTKKRDMWGIDMTKKPDLEGIFRTDDDLPVDHYDKLQKSTIIFEDKIQKFVLIDEDDTDIEEEFSIK